MNTVSFSIQTAREGFYNITREVRGLLREHHIQSGLCTVFCPHTTAGITVNENADPDVVTDMLFALGKTYPDRPEFRHMEGNSAAHLKSSFVGCEKTFIVENGDLVLGTWQGIYFCEFDGPRNRRYYVKIIGE